MKRLSLPRLFLVGSALSACALTLTGCAEGMPTISFDRLDIKDIDFEQIDTDFVFKLNNPTFVGLPVSRFDYTLDFEGIDFLTGDNPEGLDVAANDATEIALPVGLTFTNIYELIEAVRGEDEIGFGLRGGFGFDTDLGPIDITYDEGGAFPALRTPTISFSKLRLANITTSDVDLELDLNIDNEHGSNLIFQNFDFSVDFAGVTVGGGAQDELGTVEGATQKTLTLPFSLNYGAALAAITAAASGERLNLGLSASTEVDTPFGIIPLSIDQSGDISVDGG